MKLLCGEAARVVTDTEITVQPAQSGASISNSMKRYIATTDVAASRAALLRSHLAA